jgi:hypothetical protein
MGQRLVLNVRRGGDVLFLLYQQWGGYTDNEAEIICRLLAVYDKDDSLETLLRKTTEAIPGSGIILPSNPLELPKIQTYLDAGIPQATDRCRGLIALTQDEMADCWVWMDDEQYLDLDGENRLIDLYYAISSPDPEEYEDHPQPIAQFLLEPITKKNALKLLDEFTKNYKDCYVDSSGNYFGALTG